MTREMCNRGSGFAEDIMCIYVLSPFTIGYDNYVHRSWNDVASETVLYHGLGSLEILDIPFKNFSLLS